VAAATFYYDPTSPYAWMAAERIGELIPDADWQAIYGFGLLRQLGRTPWVLTDEREQRLAEIEQRAARYGLPPVRWATALPKAVELVRATRIARRQGVEREFALAVSRKLFTDGGDASRPEDLRAIAAGVGLDPDALLARMAEQEVKDEVRAATEEASARGAQGIPSIIVGDEVFWGDDRLDDAAAAARH
jgi:2-hydroxychromene-2-carboxylate isomerase